MSKGSPTAIVRLPGDLKPRINAVCKADGRSFSDFLRDAAVRALIARETDICERQEIRGAET